MRQTAKRIVSLFLSACMVLTLLPVTVSAESTDSVCSIIDGGNFTSLSDALDNVRDGQTIKLLQSIDYDQSIVIRGIHIIFDLNGFDLNVTAPTVPDQGESVFPGLYVVNNNGTPGQVDLTGNGELNVSGYTGVQADDGSKATVTNATGVVAPTVYGGIGAQAAEGSEVTVLNDAIGDTTGARGDRGGTVNVRGDAIGGYCGAYSTGANALVEVRGDATATGANIGTSFSYVTMGAYAEDGGEVNVLGDATAATTDDDISPYGALANFEGTVTVHGDATATGKLSSGACAQNGMPADNPDKDKDGGTVTVYGDAKGERRGATSVSLGSVLRVKGDAVATGTDGIGARANSGSKLTVEGDATGVQYGVLALNDGEIVIDGNVAATGIGAGAVTGDDGPGTVTVDGVITVTDPSKYIDVGTFSVPEYKTIADISEPTTAGYHTYSSNSNCVWVKIPPYTAPAPTVVSAETSADGSKVLVTFSKAMDSASIGEGGGFSVYIDGSPASFDSAPDVTGAVVEFKLSTSSVITSGQAVTVSYDADDGTAKAADGGVLADFSDQPVTNRVDAGPGPEPTYGITVGGVAVGVSNRNDITGEGITGTVSYDPDTKTLTLNNATITPSKIPGEGNPNAINSDQDLTVKLIGANVLGTVPQNPDTADYTITSGIYAPGKDITVTGSGSLTIYDHISGIEGKNVTVDITGTLTVRELGNGAACCLKADGGTLTVKRGTLNLSSQISNGLYGDRIVINGGTITAQSAQDLAFSRAPVFGSGYAHTVTAGNDAASARQISSPTAETFTARYVKIAPKTSGGGNGGSGGGSSSGGRTVVENGQTSGQPASGKPVVSVQNDPQGKPVVTVGASPLPNAKPLTAPEIAQRAANGTLNETVNPNGVWDGKTTGANNVALVIDTREATLTPGGSQRLGVSAFAGPTGCTLRVKASRDGFVTITANADGTYTITANRPVADLFILVEILDADGNVVGHSSMKLNAAAGLTPGRVENRAATIA